MGRYFSSLTWTGTSQGSRSRPARRSPKRRRALIVEDLEGRRLLSRAVEAIATLPVASSNMISGPGGDLWVAVNPTADSSAIDRIGLNGSVTSFPVPVNASGPFRSIPSLAIGPDGNIWFDAIDSSSDTADELAVGYVTPAGQVTVFPPIPLAAAQYAIADLDTMAAGPGGDVWFGYSVIDTAKQVQDFIGRVTPSGAITLFPISSLGTDSPFTVYSLAAGPDGNLWFTEGLGNAFVLGRMSPSGVVTKLPFHQLVIGSVTDGPKGSLVVTGLNHELECEVYHATTSGTITRDKIPAAISGSFNTYLGSADGSLWFTNEYGNLTGQITIGRINHDGVATSQKLTHVFSGETAEMSSMAIGGDGNLYVLDTFQPKTGPFIARVYRLSPSRLA